MGPRIDLPSRVSEKKTFMSSPPPPFSVTLAVTTPPDWASTALSDFDAFLLDHASCERKACAVGLSFVVGYPERTLLIEPMIQFAREELEHFHQVYRIIESRGLQLGEDSPDEYVNFMMKEVRTGREQRLLDRLLVCSLIEARSHERLELVAHAMTDEKLRHLYARLARAEGHHKDFFLDVARLYFSDAIVRSRLDYFTELEARAIRSVPIRSAMH